MSDSENETRRTFLKLAGTTTLVSLAGCLNSGGGGGDGNGGGGGKSPKKTFKLGGKVADWQGRAPSSIEEKTNPRCR